MPVLKANITHKIHSLSFFFDLVCFCLPGHDMTYFAAQENYMYVQVILGVYFPIDSCANH